MATYRFYPAADEQQDRIWVYSYEKWGEGQAEKYLRQLHRHLQLLADRDLPWRRLPANFLVPADLNTAVFFSRYEKHFIFFREFGDHGIGIMSILHHSMDIPVRLSDDLRAIERRADP